MSNGCNFGLTTMRGREIFTSWPCKFRLGRVGKDLNPKLCWPYAQNYLNYWGSLQLRQSLILTETCGQYLHYEVVNSDSMTSIDYIEYMYVI